MAQRKLFEVLSPKPGKTEVMSGRFTIGASGAISGQTGAMLSGVTVTQDTTGGAVGRYLLTFYRTFKNPPSCQASFQGPAAGSAFPTTTGSRCVWRSVTANTLTASLQLIRSDTQADADAASGSVVNFLIAST
jgi:hypothetical protein